MDATFRVVRHLEHFLLLKADSQPVWSQIPSLDLLLLPLAFGCLSLFWQIVVGGTNYVGSTEDHTLRIPDSWTERFKVHARSYGGYDIFGFMLTQFIGILSLLCLSIITPQQHCQAIYLPSICIQPMIITFAYSCSLAIVSLTSKSLSVRAARHNNFLLILTLGIYTYRDVWPLSTYTLEPEDKAEGNILWAKILILVGTALIIPLFTPNAYVPVDPKHPMAIPGRELVDPWISRLLFGYIDPVVVLANKVSHLNHDQLPLLLDVDSASYVTEKNFPHLDPLVGGKERHIFWGLLYCFRREFLVIVFCLLCTSVCTFAAPFSIMKIVGYLESGGQDTNIKPWLWVALFLVGALVQSVLQHWELYTQTVIMVRAQAILTQLVFDHSLRIRLKAEMPDDRPLSGTITPSTPSNADGGVRDQSEDEQGGRDNEAQSYSTVAATVTNDANQPKPKAKTDAEDDKKKSTSDTENLLGRVNNLVTSDVASIVDGTEFPSLVIYVPLQICLSIVFLSRVLGWSAFVCLFSTFSMGPVAGYFAKKMQDLQTSKMKTTDARVQLITEAIGVLRMVKLFGWEAKMSQKVKEKREDELRWLWKTSVLGVVTGITSNVIPTLAMFATYATYTVIMKEELTASKIFSSIAVFNILRDQILQISWQASMMVQTKVSLDRFTTFLNETELLDQFTNKKKEVENIPVNLQAGDINRENKKIGFRDATFMWSAWERDGMLTPASRHFRLRIEGELLFRENSINMIVGPTGSGKTSLLMALLGEMHFVPTQVDSWYNLPRGGGIAYAAQESWVQNATVRENILFGAPYDEERYKKVIYQCALARDLELFDAGDRTEVGERGLTLSGGQKARVTLARAIYSNAQIILLDDVLAALDVHTSVWIVNKCFRGDLAKGRTVILVTHNVALVGPIAEFVVSLGINGSVQSQGTDVSTLVDGNLQLASEVEEEQEILVEINNEIKPATSAAPDGKLVIAEEIVQGHVTWKSIQLLMSALGGRHPILFTLFLFGSVGIASGLETAQTWFLGVWGSQYEHHSASDVRLSFYLGVFALLIVAHFGTTFSFRLYYNYRMVSASRTIHAKLIDSVLGSTFRWLDETPTGRIITRCTQDIRAVDSSVPSNMRLAVDLLTNCLVKLGAIVLFTPVFLLPGVAVGVAGALLGSWYLKTQLSIRREMSNARSPLLSHFNAAMHGLVSIRAYGAQQAVRQESLKRIDHYTRTARTSWNLNRWIGLRMDFLGAMFISLLAFYQIYVQTSSAANTGFSLNMAVSFCGMIFYLIRVYNTFEVESNSLERIQTYLDIDHEPESEKGRLPPASWPTSGDLRVENLSARYSASGPEVLHSLSFHIRSGEHVGVVGRTGSGKSSLTLALLRCILTEGTVFYDGIPTNTLNLDALRSSITIIPQTPELLSGEFHVSFILIAFVHGSTGTLRQNLDPFDQNDDAVLNDALRASGLFSLQEVAGEPYLSLDSNIAGGGGNLSVGQRQIIALARAMVRGSKLLILDEATSAIDYKTDSVVQHSLRTQLGSDTTVITVAHRLQTIMDADRIMVLDKGQIVEFDTPASLLKKENGVFKGFVDGTEDKHVLYGLQKSMTVAK